MLGFESFCVAPDLGGKRLRVVRIVKTGVLDAHGAVGEFNGEVAHGREEECGPLAVAGDVGGFLGGFHHQDSVALGVEIAQGGGVVVELIAEHDRQLANGAGDAE